MQQKKTKDNQTLRPNVEMWFVRSTRSFCRSQDSEANVARLGLRPAIAGAGEGEGPELTARCRSHHLLKKSWQRLLTTGHLSSQADAIALTVFFQSKKAFKT